MPWEEFINNEGFPAEDQCGFLYSYYWTRGHEPHDQVTVGHIKITTDKAVAEVSITFVNERIGENASVYLIKSKGKWLISQIVFNDF